MALAAHFILWSPDNKPIPSQIPVKDEENSDLTASEVHAFEHLVWSDYLKKDWLNTYHDIRRHEPMKLVKPLDKMSASLNKYCAKFIFLPKAKIRWYRFKEKSRDIEEYLRMTLENVNVAGVKPIMPNVKEFGFEKHNPFEEITLCYQKITWLYHQGYRIHSDEWNNFFDEFNQKDLNKKQEMPEASDAPQPLKITFISGKFVEPDDGFDFDKTVTVKFVSDISGKIDNNNQKKVYCKLYSKYGSNPAQDCGVIQEGYLRNNGSYECSFKLVKNKDYDKDAKKAADAQVEYYAEIENKIAGANFKSEPLKIPSSSNEFKYVFPIEKLKTVAKNLSEYEFILWLGSIFGHDIPKSVHKKLLDMISNGSMTYPPCLIVENNDSNLQGHEAGYDRQQQKIYITKNLIEQAESDNKAACKLLIALCEEVGHHLDNLLRKESQKGGDGPKDEGANFSYHLLSEECDSDSTSDIGSIENPSKPIKFSRTDLLLSIESWLSKEQIDWDDKTRWISFFGGGTTIDDVFEEMEGTVFKVVRNFIGKEKARDVKVMSGQEVRVIKWDRADLDINVAFGPYRFTIPVYLLEPSRDKTSKLQYYSVGLNAQLHAVNQAENAKDDPGPVQETEKIRRQEMFKKKAYVYAQMLVRETMYNRFDSFFQKWTDHYNKELKPKQALNPNIVKSMAYQESKMGTSGEHLELPPYNWNDGQKFPIRSRFNIVQAIDSYCPEQYLLIKELSPKYYEDNKLSEFEKRKKWQSMTEGEYVSKGYWNVLKNFSINESGKMPNTGIHKYDAYGLFTNYEYWIRAAIRWLFYKYENTVKQSSWSDAVKAFNGAGPKAENYRTKVMSRINTSTEIEVKNN